MGNKHGDVWRETLQTLRHDTSDRFIMVVVAFVCAICSACIQGMQNIKLITRQEQPTSASITSVGDQNKDNGDTVVMWYP